MMSWTRPATEAGGFWGRAACLLASLIVLLHVDASRLADPDLFVTLYAGAEIAAQGGAPRTDTVSFSVEGQPWVDYEWLARLVFHVAHTRFGNAGLVALRLVLGTVFLLALYDLARRRRGGWWAFVAAVLVLTPTGLRFFMFRPTLFTFALLAVWLALIDRARDQEKLPLVLFPLLLVLWVNLHGGYALAIVLQGLLVMESGIVTFLRRWRVADAPAPVVPLGSAALSFAASLAATGAGPYGYANWLAIVGTLGGGITPGITEWQPMYTFGLLHHLPAYLLMAAVTAVLAAAWRKVGLFDLLLVASLLLASLLRVRFVPLFSIAAATVLIRLLPAVPVPSTWRRWLAGTPRLRPAVVALLALLVAGLWKVEGVTDSRIEIVEWLTPVAGVKFLEANGVTGPTTILNEYVWGGYIRYRLPQARIFVDGRSDTVYPEETVRQWSTFVDGAPASYRVPIDYGAKLILLRREHAVVRRLEKDPDWVPAYADAYTALFIRDCPENAPVLARLRAGKARVPVLTAEDYTLHRSGRTAARAAMLGALACFAAHAALLVP